MSLVTLPYVFSPGTTIRSSEANSNNNAIVGDYNGNIQNVNIAAAAAIAESKLAFGNPGHQHSGGADGAPIRLAQGADLASAASVTVGTDGNIFNLTGSVTVAALSSRPINTLCILNLVAGTTFTYNAVSLILAPGTDAILTAGDILAFISLGSGNWKELFRATRSGGGSGGANLGLIYAQIVNQAERPVPFL